MEAGIFPRVKFWRFSQNRPPTRVSRTFQNREPDLHRHGGIAEKTSFGRKNIGRRMRSCKYFRFIPQFLSDIIQPHGSLYHRLVLLLITLLVGLFKRVHSSIHHPRLNFRLKIFQSVFSFQFNSQNCEICFTSPFTLHYPYILPTFQG